MSTRKLIPIPVVTLAAGSINPRRRRVMKCANCESKFINGDTVLVSDLGAVCAKSCADHLDSLRGQTELIPKWEQQKWAETVFAVNGCKVEKAVVLMTKGSPVIQIVMNLPGGSSVDEIKDFCGRTVELKITKGELVAIKKVAKKKDKPVAV